MSNQPFVSQHCQGERCGFETDLIEGSSIRCGKPAEHKVEEWVFADDPTDGRHPLTQYLCHAHFRLLMGPMADKFRVTQP